MSEKAPLLLDVDGVINRLFVGVDEILDEGLVAHDATADDGQTYRLHVDPALGDWLSSLTSMFEFVWCTTWRNANEAISPILGLPQDLRQVPLPRHWTDVPLNLHRKTGPVRRWAAENGLRRLAWIDDEFIGDADADALLDDWSDAVMHSKWQRDFIETPPLEDVLLLRCKPSLGITPSHIDILHEWGAR